MTIAAARAGISAAQSLTLLLTTESLLFAALAVSVALSAPVAGGRGISPAAVQRFALAIASVIAAVALAAAAAWWQVFGELWPSSWLSRLEAVGVALGIVAEVGIAVAVVRAVRR